MTVDHPTRILVVDDDPSVRDILGTLLRDEGCGVSEAENGEVALKILQASEEPMVVMLDVHMPVLDGETLVSIVAADQRLASLHTFLLMTASPDCICDKTKQLLHRLQIPVIPKPFKLATLIDVIEEIGSHQGANVPPGSETAVARHQEAISS